jgi:hypothetical protein
MKLHVTRTSTYVVIFERACGLCPKSFSQGQRTTACINCTLENSAPAAKKQSMPQPNNSTIISFLFVIICLYHLFRIINIIIIIIIIIVLVGANENATWSTTGLEPRQCGMIITNNHVLILLPLTTIKNNNKAWENK